MVSRRVASDLHYLSTPRNSRIKPTLALGHQDTTMSSPASRSSRKSTFGTPRSARISREVPGSPLAASAQNSINNPLSSPQQPVAQATPRATRQNFTSSSPLFFRSSPANGGEVAANGGDRMEISSPLRQTSSAVDNDLTPRGRANPPNGL